MYNLISLNKIKENHIPYLHTSVRRPGLGLYPAHGELCDPHKPPPQGVFVQFSYPFLKADFSLLIWVCSSSVCWEHSPLS